MKLEGGLFISYNVLVKVLSGVIKEGPAISSFYIGRFMSVWIGFSGAKLAEDYDLLGSSYVMWVIYMFVFTLLLAPSRDASLDFFNC